MEFNISYNLECFPILSKVPKADSELGLQTFRKLLQNIHGCAYSSTVAIDARLQQDNGARRSVHLSTRMVWQWHFDEVAEIAHRPPRRMTTHTDSDKYPIRKNVGRIYWGFVRIELEASGLQGRSRDAPGVRKPPAPLDRPRWCSR